MAAPRSRAWLTPACAVALLLACAGPLPSAEPLGGIASQPKKAGRHTDRKANPSVRAKEVAHGSDGGPAKVTLAIESEADEVTPVQESKPAPSGVAEAPAVIAGDYVGEDVAIYKVAGTPDRTERDPKARTTVKVPDDSTVEIVIVDSSNGKEICSLDADRKGPTATIRAGQKCFEQDSGDASAVGTVETGTATFSASRLVVEMRLAFEAHFGDRAMSGSIEYRFDGTRR